MGFKPRVLFVLPATVMGGAEIRLFGMVRAFKAIEPLLAGHRQLLDRVALDIEVHALDEFRDCHDPYPYDWRNVGRYAAAVAAIARRSRPQVTFGWMHNGSSFVLAAKLLHGLDTATAGCILGPLTDHFALNNRQATPYERVLFGTACRCLDRTVAPSQGVREDLIRHFGAPPPRIETIYNGVDLERITHLAAATPDLPLPEKRGPWILAASRLSLEKGLDVMIRAFSRLRKHQPATLIILGEGPLRQDLLTLAQQLGVHDQVLLPGHATNPFPWMAKADIFTLASRLEGFGTALVEAMALGIPVVSTACRAGPREILAQAGSGLLVPVDDDAALAEAWLDIISSPRLQERLAAGARQRARQFSFAAMCHSYERMLCRLNRS